ncbi:hypothetical protein [Lacinutrix chionoecetis]
MIKLTTLLSVLSFLNFGIISATVENTNTESITKECNFTHTNPIIVHNASVGIFPGDGSNRKIISKDMIRTLPVDMILTGIEAAEDGKQLVIYATTGDITLMPNHSSSSIGNRIEQSSNMTITQGSAFELTYSAAIGKWVITDSL